MIQLPVIFDGAKLNKDGSATIKLETRELTPDEFREVATLCNKEVWCGLSEVSITKLDVPEEIVEFKGEKTPSERLRNVLYRYWELVNKKQGDFETFRKNYMEKVITNLKEKLPDEN